MYQSVSHRRETLIARQSPRPRKTLLIRPQSLRFASSFWAHQDQRGFNRSLLDCTGKFPVSQPSFETECHFVGIDLHQIAFLRDKIYWQNIVFSSDDHKVRGSAARVIGKLDRDMTRVPKHFIVALPFAFEFLRYWRAPRLDFNLWGSCFL